MKQCITDFKSYKIFQVSLPVILIVFMLLMAQTGCSSFNGTRLESTLGIKTNLIQFSYTIADQLAENTLPPLIRHHPDMPILITTFVDNNNLEQTSQLGRILQEHIASRFVQLGYTVREIKLSSTLNIEQKSGETILSRDLSQLKTGQQAQAILAGTYSRINRILYISARLINPTNHNILATNDYKLYMDDDILAMFESIRQPDEDKLIAEPRQPFLNSIF